MKNIYTGDNLNNSSNSYGSYSSYGNHPQFNNSSHRYGGNPGYGNYGYGSYGNVTEENGPQRTFKDYVFLIRERIWYLIIVFLLFF